MKCGMHFKVLLTALVLVSAFASLPAAVAQPQYGARLEGFDYPFPVRQFGFSSQQRNLEMAYMDVLPSRPNGRTALLMHGKNFCSATWEKTIKTLADAGYRVIAADQIGFCKSSKPAHYQYSFQQLAHNTRALLAQRGVDRVTLIGHSTGGMLAMRYALMYPQQVEQVVLVNPIGLEDWKAKGVPSLSVDQWYQRELQTTAERIRNYEKATYYSGQWRPEYEQWVGMLAGLAQGPGKDTVAWNSALIYDMIFTQPVVYEFEQMQAPTLLLIGMRDTTAIGKDAAPEQVKARIGHYPELAREAVRRIPNARLVAFPELGHAPQIQDPDTFHKALLEGLGSSGPASEAP